MRSSVLTALFIAVLASFLLVPKGVFAETLFFSPASGSYTQGQTFSVRIMVSSAQAVNAVSATLSFPNDKLQVTSISKIGSILNLWVTEPSFSNSNGTVSLEGVVPNPGFSGSNGQVLTVNFKAIDTGTASLSFPSGQILANDGYGTDILRGKGTASFSLAAAPLQASKAQVEPTAQEEAPAEAPAPSYVDLNQKAPAPETKTISIALPSFKAIYDWLMTFLSFAIPLLALVYLLIHTAKRGSANIRALRKDLHGLDRLVEKSFDIIKEDVMESIRILEKAQLRRKLTSEEGEIIRRLRQNLVDAEKIIHKEVLKAEKDLGD